MNRKTPLHPVPQSPEMFVILRFKHPKIFENAESFYKYALEIEQSVFFRYRCLYCKKTFTDAGIGNYMIVDEPEVVVHLLTFSCSTCSKKKQDTKLEKETKIENKGMDRAPSIFQKLGGSQ